MPMPLPHGPVGLPHRRFPNRLQDARSGPPRAQSAHGARSRPPGDGRATPGQACAAAGAARVRTSRRVAVHDADTSGVHTEFLRSHLRIAMRMPVPTSTLLVYTVMEPSAAIDRKLSTSFNEGAAVGRRWRLLDQRRQTVAKRKGNDEPAGDLQPVAPIDVEGGSHWPVARKTAFRMRVCVPHRQRFPASAFSPARLSASESARGAPSPP